MFSFEAKAEMPKGERTRVRLLNTAFSLFIQNGYEKTTLRDIAADAGTSLGLTYRYFRRKEELVLALYEGLAEEFVRATGELPSGGVAMRFARAVELKLEQIAPYRELFGVLLRNQLDPNSPLAVLGGRAASVREQGIAVFRNVVRGATDAPPSDQHEQLALVLYALHLGILLLWQFDRDDNQHVGQRALRLTEGALALAMPLLGTPQAANVLGNVAELFASVAQRAPAARATST